MAESDLEKLERLERELADARSRLLSFRQEAAVCRSRADQAERDEFSLSQLLAEIAKVTRFPVSKPVSYLPGHVREMLR